MDNTGGAKPKTVTSINNNGTNGQQAGSSSSNSTQTLGAQPPRHRSQRMENGYLPRSSGRAPRGMRGYNGNSSSGGGGGSSTNGYSSRAMGDDSTNRRATVPAATGGRARHSSSTQTRSSVPHQRFTDYSPLRGANRLETRAMPWQNSNPEFRRRPLRYMNPVPRVRDLMPGGPLESPNGDVLPPLSPCLPPPASPSLHGILSSSEDSDSESGSPVSPLGGSSLQLQSPASSMGESLALPQANGDHPPGLYPYMGRERDAVLARELLQSEMDMMMQRDEAMARQLQDEIDDDDDDDDGDRPSNSSSSLIFSGMPPARSRRFRVPTIPRRQDRPVREGRGPSTLRFMNYAGPSSPERADLDPVVRHAMNLLGVGRPRGMAGSAGLGRATGPTDAEGRRRRPRPGSPDIRNPDAPYEEFDPERLLASGMEPPDDFLPMMNDPSLMLLMLLLRAPDSLYHNEAGVDLDDYEALWDLAEQLGEVRHRGMSEEEVGRLPTQKFKSQSDEEGGYGGGDGGDDASAAEPAARGAATLAAVVVQCQICLVDFENGDCLRCIPCRHDFHKDCIDQWLKRNATCPICRQDVRPPFGDK